MNERQNIYDELSILLTYYETTSDILETELYEMLVKIQNNWETVITAVD